jgi:hypothetical protein
MVLNIDLVILSDDEIDKMISELRVKYRDDKLETLLKKVIFNIFRRK